MNKSIVYAFIGIISLSLLVACEDFIDPVQELVLSEDMLPGDEVELRAMSLGLYSIQQELVEQIVILGELRADLLEITDNADPDLYEVYNFNISSLNRYANPVNFYKLIAASNKLIRILEKHYPQVTDEEAGLSNYHYMYGEAICMRSWAYFNAARIFNEIPYIPETLTNIAEIEAFVNSSGTYIDSSYIDYHPNGLNNDTLIKVYEYTDRRFLDQDAITKLCIGEIEQRVRAVGVDYSYDNNDDTWNITLWNEYAKNVLLGQMYLHLGDYVKAMENFNVILQYADADDAVSNVRFGLTHFYGGANWKGIFNNVNANEHIFSLWFGKTNLSWQLNSLQSYFSAIAPNNYALKPTKKAVELWETVWKGKIIVTDAANPQDAYTFEPGVPGDNFRGHGISYRYLKNGKQMSASEVAAMLDLKKLDNINELADVMEGVDTVVYKYSYGKSAFDQDANFIIYRAAQVHLYAAEIYANWVYESGGFPRQFITRAEQYIYDGSYQGDPRQLGVAGRVGLGDNRGFSVDNDIIYKFHPYNNEIIGYKVNSTTQEKQLYMEEIVLDEKARELAFEGERFYDLIRVARRRNKMGLDGSGMLATIVSEKFPVSQREHIKQILQDESSWYIPFELR